MSNDFLIVNIREENTFLRGWGKFGCSETS